jgi:hypothetical protein
VSDTSRLRREDGQATVEFAIVIPLLLLVVVGIFEFGKAFNYWIDLNHLSNEGARWAAVDKVPPHDGIAGNPAPQRIDIKQYILSQLDTGDLKSKVEQLDGAPAGTVDPNLCNIRVDTPNGANAQIGDPLSVSISAPGYAIASLGEAIQLGTVNLGSKSTMRLEQVPTWAQTPDPCGS